MLVCKACGHEDTRHLPMGGACLSSGCMCSECESIESSMMFAVRIDKKDEMFLFQVTPMEMGPELIALDSTPGVIAFVEAPNPGAACQRAWEKGQRELASLGGLPPSSPKKLPELLGDKT